jgi:hypothetical protein
MLYGKHNTLFSTMGFCLILVAWILVIVPCAQAATVLAPTGPASQAWSEKMQNNEFNLEGAEQYAKWSDGKTLFEARGKGLLEFTDDDRDVKSISRDGYLQLKDESDGVVRSLEISPGQNGTLQKSYAVGGERREFDAEARAWLGMLLPVIIHHTAIGAEARVQRILREGGAGHVLDEVSLIEPNSAKLIYLRFLFKGKLAAVDLQRAARLVAREVSSDGDKARFLVESCNSYLVNEAAAASFFDAINSISADGDRRRVLTALIEKNGLGRGSLLRVMDSARQFSSDGDKGEFLSGAAHRYLGDDELATAFFATVGSIRADGDHKRVLSLLLSQRPLRHETVLRAVKAVSGVRSDGDKAGFLLEVVQLHLQDLAVITAVREAAAGISSEGDRLRVLAALRE